MISLIVAYDNNYGIGRNNKLPWKLPKDLKNFKQITKSKYVVMGRKTFESIGKPLPNRKNLILTKNKKYYQENCIILHDHQKIIDFAKSTPQEEIFIIGGAQIYKKFIENADRIYETKVNTEISDIDVFFPKWDESEFKCIGKKLYKKDADNQFDFYFRVMEKI